MAITVKCGVVGDVGETENLQITHGTVIEAGATIRLVIPTQRFKRPSSIATPTLTSVKQGLMLKVAWRIGEEGTGRQGVVKFAFCDSARRVGVLGAGA